MEMEHLDRFKPSYGTVKLADGRIMSVGGTIGGVRGDLKDKITSSEKVNAFGVASKGNWQAKQHAVVMEGYVYDFPGRGEHFYMIGGTSYNAGCRNAVNGYYMRLRHPTSRITCKRCQKRIEDGLV